MKIYIAGKITGDPNYKQKFDQAARRIEAQGDIAISLSVLPEGMGYGDYMKICFAMIDIADAVAFLPDHGMSKGAMLEWQYCKYVCKQMIFIEDTNSEY